jgi:YidC/Oxa1 family membrane protein insertase
VDKRFTIFLISAVAIVVTNQVIVSLFFPQPEKPVARKDATKVAKADKRAADTEAPQVKAAPADKAVEPPNRENDEAPAPKEPAKPDGEEPAAPAAPTFGPQRGTLGSGDPASPYRMLVTWNNHGATIERVELNSPRYRESSEVRSGYLGYLAPADAPHKGGATVRVVGPGTPAALAGLQSGDVITELAGRKIATAADLVSAIDQTEPDQEITLAVRRQDEAKQLTARLTRRPMPLIRAEDHTKPVEVIEAHNHDPLSFLTTIAQFDERSIGESGTELGGVNLHASEWEVVAANQNVVSFRQSIPKLGLQVTKTFRLESVPADKHDDRDYPAYSLILDVSIANTGDAAHEVSYRLDGPTGLPLEGAWYAGKVSREMWASAGLRDIIARFRGGKPTQVGSPDISKEDFKLIWTNTPLDYIAVDAQYFAAAVIPQKEDPSDLWFREVRPIRVGAVPKEKANWRLTDVSFRLDSVPQELQPGGPPLAQRFQVFVGPKQPDLLAQYAAPGTNVTLNDLVYYGWFWFVAEPMLAILHFFHGLVGNYGIAIVMLTILVRGCMFPLSRKQAASSAKMQLLQPEIKKINEKYKTDLEKRSKALGQLYKEHNFHPLGGCLPALIQLPIFVGLYSSLRVDVELRQAPLLSERIRWASDLSAPDMLWNWSAVMPEFVTTGFLNLGPYFNVLPLVTIGLFIWQQKMFMPPPADEQAQMQQKVMQYMMIVMGVLFFKVSSGLCVYIIASSTWGIIERMMLGTSKTPQSPTPVPQPASAPEASGNGSSSAKKRQRGRK